MSDQAQSTQPDTTATEAKKRTRNRRPKATPAEGAENTAANAPAATANGGGNKGRSGRSRRGAQKTEGGGGAAAGGGGERSSVYKEVSKVGAQTASRSIGGFIANNGREGRFPKLTAVGPAPNNQAVKGIAIARQMLLASNDDFDITFQPSFVTLQGGGSVQNGLQHAIVKSPKPAADEVQATLLKVGGKTEAKGLAGAIANKVREGAKVELTSIGPAAANQALKAIAIARKNLEAQKMDLLCRPEFEHVTLESTRGTKESNGLKFLLIVQKV